MTAEPWVSVDQIAEHLGVTRDSIYRWIDRKGLPAHRVGRLWKFQVPRWITGCAPVVPMSMRLRKKRARDDRPHRIAE